MQDVSFFIVRSRQGGWLPVILEIEKHGYDIDYDVVESELTFVLDGAMVNPMVFSGKKILFTHPSSWGKEWDGMYKDIVVEYYDTVYDISTMPLDCLMDVIRGEIEATESRSKD